MKLNHLPSKSSHKVKQSFFEVLSISTQHEIVEDRGGQGTEIFPSNTLF